MIVLVFSLFSNMQDLKKKVNPLSKAWGAKPFKWLDFPERNESNNTLMWEFPVYNFWIPLIKSKSMTKLEVWLFRSFCLFWMFTCIHSSKCSSLKQHPIAWPRKYQTRQHGTQHNVTITHWQNIRMINRKTK